jgi:hypothetical protein
MFKFVFRATCFRLQNQNVNKLLVFAVFLVKVQASLGDYGSVFGFVFRNEAQNRNSPSLA